MATRMLVLENGYDAGLLSGDMFREPDPHAPLRFGYLGTLTDQYDNRAFWEGWQLAQQEEELSGASAHIYGHLGFFAGAPQRHGLPAASLASVRYHGPVSKAEVAGVYRDLDVLLFLVPSSPYVTSARPTSTWPAASRSLRCTPPTRPPPVHCATIHSPRRSPICRPRRSRDALVRAARLARTATKVDYDAAVEHARGYDRARLLPRVRGRDARPRQPMRE